MLTTYRELLELTGETIEGRRRAYRLLLVVVLVLLAGPPVAAVATGDVAWLAAWLGLVPSIAGFLVIDERRVRGWRSSVLEGWVRQEIDLHILADTLRRSPQWPTNTVEGMLCGLDGEGGGADREAPRRALRSAMAVAVEELSRTQSLRVASFGVGAFVGLAAPLAVVATRSWWPATGLLLCLLAGAFSVVAGRRRLRRAAERIDARLGAPADRERLRRWLRVAGEAGPSHLRGRLSALVAEEPR